MWGDPAKNMRLAKEGPWAECAMNITPQDCWAAADEIDRLRAALRQFPHGLSLPDHNRLRTELLESK